MGGVTMGAAVGGQYPQLAKLGGRGSTHSVLQLHFTTIVTQATVM